MGRMSHVKKGIKTSFAEAMSESIVQLSFVDFYAQNEWRLPECDCGLQGVVHGYAHTKTCVKIRAEQNLFKRYLSDPRNREFVKTLFPKNTTTKELENKCQKSM